MARNPIPHVVITKIDLIKILSFDFEIKTALIPEIKNAAISEKNNIIEISNDIMD